jgi:histidine decarboxylase
MDWENIFFNVSRGVPYEGRSLDQINAELEPLKEEWVRGSLHEYIAQFSLSDTQIQALKDRAIRCDAYYNNNRRKREYHFGYPANMLERSFVYRVMAQYECSGFLSNNCGDTYEPRKYGMDSKDIEKSILELFAKKFAIENLQYWGYITSGGSESNNWGIDNAFRTNPDGILYFSQASHYSIPKHAVRYPHVKISQTSPTDESIDCNHLLKTILANREKPANILLSWGTTKFGSCDNISEIVYRLKSAGVKFYIHVDAALYGGIPNNQIDAPLIKEVGGFDVGSISVSLHKYIGVPFVKSVLLATSSPVAQMVDYIGQRDSTTAGSRDIMPFSMWQQVFETLMMTPPGEYIRNINLFVKLLEDAGIPYIRSGKGNIFVIDQPRDDICEKYQLSTFSLNDEEKSKKAHVIIFPYQSNKIIEQLVDDLKPKR